jgi:hypothetical protein
MWNINSKKNLQKNPKKSKEYTFIHNYLKCHTQHQRNSKNNLNEPKKQEQNIRDKTTKTILKEERNRKVERSCGGRYATKNRSIHES